MAWVRNSTDCSFMYWRYAPQPEAIVATYRQVIMHLYLLAWQSPLP